MSLPSKGAITKAGPILVSVIYKKGDKIVIHYTKLLIGHFDVVKKNFGTDGIENSKNLKGKYHLLQNLYQYFKKRLTTKRVRKKQNLSAMNP